LIWLADENVPVRTILRLREAGLDLASIREIAPGSSDVAVLRRAHRDGRGLITFDRDFGELIFLQRCDCPPSVVYLRFIPSYPEEPAEVFLALLGSHETLEGAFVVLDRDSLRKRPLPQT
jgi:predicted nuclease of predicted toxin-antitoxin system